MLKNSPGTKWRSFSEDDGWLWLVGKSSCRVLVRCEELVKGVHGIVPISGHGDEAPDGGVELERWRVAGGRHLSIS